MVAKVEIKFVESLKTPEQRQNFNISTNSHPSFAQME